MSKIKEQTTENVKNWKSTIVGIITAVVPLLVAVGIIPMEKAEQLLGNSVNLVETISVVISGLGGLWLIFKSKD